MLKKKFPLLWKFLGKFISDKRKIESLFFGRGGGRLLDFHLENLVKEAEILGRKDENHEGWPDEWEFSSMIPDESPKTRQFLPIPPFF